MSARMKAIRNWAVVIIVGAGLTYVSPYLAIGAGVIFVFLIWNGVI